MCTMSTGRAWRVRDGRAPRAPPEMCALPKNWFSQGSDREMETLRNLPSFVQGLGSNVRTETNLRVKAAVGTLRLGVSTAGVGSLGRCWHGVRTAVLENADAP